MSRVHDFSLRLLMASLVLCSCFVAATLAQTPSPSPSPSPSPDAAKKQEQANPFAPEPAQPLPPGLTGSDASDPRANLAPGIFDAGEAAMGMKHVLLVKKPEAFQLGSDDPENPRVKKTLGSLGFPADTSKIPQGPLMVTAQLAFANSDIAFQGNHLFQGNFYGINIYDISNPAKTSLLTSMICPGGQGDVSVYKNLLFMSVEMANGRLDCGTEGFPPAPPPTASAPQTSRFGPPPAQKDR